MLTLNVEPTDSDIFNGGRVTLSDPDSETLRDRNGSYISKQLSHGSISVDCEYY